MAAYRWTWTTWHKNIAHYFYDLKNGLANLPVFFSAVWWFRSWDFDGLLALMQVATREMEKGHRLHGYDPRIARQLLIVTTVCERIRADEYFEKAGYRQGDDWHSKTDGERQLIAQRAGWAMKSDIRILGKTLRHLPKWWD